MSIDAHQHLIGDHPVLDLLNTVKKVEGVLVDSLQTDEDVLRWLRKVQGKIKLGATGSHKGLVSSARALRESVRTAVEQRKAGKPIELRALNQFLSQSTSHLKLFCESNGDFNLERLWDTTVPAQLLSPLAESAADLLVHGDFQLIRRCEDAACILWFYDRTKSHQRRWCSMSTCGNRE